MSGLWMLRLLQEAAAALPNGTAKERAAWCVQRQRELKAGAPPREQATDPKPFAAVADDPAVQKANREADR